MSSFVLLSCRLLLNLLITPLLSKAPLSLEWSTSASIVRTAEVSSNTCRIDPAADLREAWERNAWEVREEKEAAAKKEEANKAASARAA